MKRSLLAALVASIMGSGALGAISGCGSHNACSDQGTSTSGASTKTSGGLVAPRTRAPFRTGAGSIDTRDLALAANDGADPSASGSGDCGAESGAAASQTDGGSATGTQVSAGIQYFGRWDFSDATNPVGNWGDIYLKAKFEGTSIGIKLSDGNNDFQWSVDGAPMQRLSPNAENVYTLSSGLGDGTHTLELYRLTEGSFGLTTVNGLILEQGKKLLAGDPRPSRKIEIIGDSISAGYGNANAPASPAPDFGRHMQNGYMAYGPQLARMLGAEWSVVAHSGQGLYRNVCEPLPPGNDHMPDEFKLMFYPDGTGDADPQWRFDMWQPDVLVIALGTNDFMDYPPGSCGLPADSDFTDAYVKFLGFVRSVYPSVEVFALGTLGAVAGNPLARANADICSAVTTVQGMGDSHVHCIDPGATGPNGAWLPNETDFVGDWTHPTIAGDTTIANELRDIIKPIMGW
jgi:lysophospholipase L1-like esterase